MDAYLCVNEAVTAAAMAGDREIKKKMEGKLEGETKGGETFYINEKLMVKMVH